MREQALAWIDCLLKDLRQVMNSPWFAAQLQSASPTANITTHDTTGPNFIAAGCTLAGVEAVGRLATAQENGTEAACQFMREYFPSGYHAAAPLIWKLFRHGHIHNFLPQEVQLASVNVAGRVCWLDPAPHVDQVCAAMCKDRDAFVKQLSPAHLHLEPSGVAGRYWFNFVPQVAYADFRKAVCTWRARVASSPAAEAQFSHGIHVVDKSRRFVGKLTDPIGQHIRAQGLLP